ncbi:unnamed protein product [Darwinula stevensoni]|uniref:EGF-like domain-containing protein n=1 Tax=Darwinula stevensoni TaxID=69355 RepID=A0A7R8XEU6_9CRUS|nr:unnamed protein product [Darwinula stevensoni]CAG0890026.1 unnamed protein product [Darwinula stevensoni]
MECETCSDGGEEEPCGIYICEESLMSMNKAFEFEVEKVGGCGDVYVGLCTPDASQLEKLPGTYEDSLTSFILKLLPHIKVLQVFLPVPPTLHPSIAISGSHIVQLMREVPGPNHIVPINEIAMAVDGSEKDWKTFSKIQITGQVLEYIGTGLVGLITDCGQAQASEPLTTSSHYFEVEILNPGLRHSIMIGLTSQCHKIGEPLGHFQGSIAYDLGFGRLHMAHSKGEPFGPKCQTVSAALPDASQEGLLHPYRSYTDVALFHFTVPPHSFTATWEFAAFMDDPSCPSREVHIFMQHGSYPVMSPDNSSFPEGMHTSRTHLYKIETWTAYSPHDAVILPIHNPLPGSWFAAAYLPDWDQQVQQEGIIHRCRYSLGSIAFWTVASNVGLVPVNQPTFLHSKEHFTYYRFYVPENVWNIQVELSRCEVIVQYNESKPENCLSGVYLRPNALPSVENSTPLGPLQSKKSMNWNFSPHTDSYYYLLFVGESVAQFQIEIYMKECQPSSLEESPRVHYFVEENMNQTQYLLHSNETVKDRWVGKVLSSNASHSSFKTALRNVSQECLPWFKLSRIKHILDFEDSFLLPTRAMHAHHLSVQGKGWYTSWLVLSERTPVIVSFNILDFVDIGGTLHVGVLMDEIILGAFTQLLVITACVQKNSPPVWSGEHFECNPELLLRATSESPASVLARKLFPFPEAGTWFVGFHLHCFINNTKVPCVVREVMASLDVHTQPCMFRDQPCGEHGICQETHQRQFYFTACKCFAGYKGWGCIDGSEAHSSSSLLLTSLFLTLSNLAFIPAIGIALRYRLFPEALVYFSTMLFSAFYHACDQEVYGYCITKFEVLQFCDFFSSILSFWMTLVSMANLESSLSSTLHILGVMLIAFGVEYNRRGLVGFIVPCAIATLVPIIGKLWACRRKKSCVQLEPKNFLYLLPGVALATGGLIIFALVETEGNYQYIHSLWHILMAASLFFLLPRRRIERPLPVQDTEHEREEAELEAVLHSEHPVFSLAALFFVIPLPSLFSADGLKHVHETSYRYTCGNSGGVKMAGVSSMYCMYKQTHPATGIEHSLYCYFFNSVERNLVVAGANALRVFRLIPDTILPQTGPSAEVPKLKLECLATFSLFGDIMSMQSVRLSSSSRDALVLGFCDAKLSVVEYDPNTHDLRTVSIHYFEDEETRRGWTRNITIPHIRVDPDSRCCVMLVYGRKIAVLPFKHDAVADDIDLELGEHKPTVLSSYLIDLKDINEKMDNVIDMQFLHGYYEPTLLILFEPLKTFSGRLAVRQDTCSFVAISLNIPQRVHPVIWTVSKLPFDCNKAIPVPKPIGGTLILAVNSLIYLNQSVPPYGVSVNSLAEPSTNFPLKVQEGVKIALDCAQALFIDSERVVISLKGGELYVLTLVTDSMRSVRSFHFDKAAASVLTACICILLNIGPCGNIAPGEPAFLSEEFSQYVDLDVELVTTSGYGKNGALCVLQHSIRPQVITTFQLPGCSDMWTVVDGKTQSGDDQGGEHAFLILSQESSTMVLQTGAEIDELDSSGFSTQGPTVFACNLGNNRYIVQVSKQAVRLLEGSEQIQLIPLDILNHPIKSASAVDPYIVLLSKDGQVVLFTLVEGRDNAKLQMSWPSVTRKSPVIAISVYCDTSGLFTSRVPEELCLLSGMSGFSMNAQGQAHDICLPTAEAKKELDEEEILYGDSGTKEVNPFVSITFTSDSDNQGTNRRMTLTRDTRPTYWVALARENGNLELYSIPDFNLRFLVKNFHHGDKVLADSAPTSVEASQAQQATQVANISEILLVGLGHHHSRPYLLAVVDEDLLIYEAYPYYENLDKSSLKMRFRNVEHHIILRERRTGKSKSADVNPPHVPSLYPKLRYFSNIAGYSGVFIAGPYPHWMFMTSRGELRLHPMSIDGAVECFAPFNNVNCPQGFLYFNRKSEMRICVLPTHLSYDAPWPARKVPLRCTPHFISFHLESKTYSVVSSISEPSDQIYKFNGEDKELCTEERDSRFPYPVNEKFFVQLFSPVSWEMIPNTKVDLEDWEHVTCLKTVNLSYEGTRSGLRGYIAIGTNYNYGEDITSRGRILIHDIINVVPEPGQPLTKNKVKTVSAKEQKGPVTALTHVRGFLVAAIGQKVYVWQLKDNDLVGIAFIDTQIFTHQMRTVKNLIFIADMYKSVSVLRFQGEHRTLSLVSKDYRPMEVYGIEYIVDNSQLAFLASDSEKNVTIYMYQPEARESYGGQRLIRRADFHLGTQVTSFFRIRCKLTDPSTEKKNPAPPGSLLEHRHATWYASLDGSLGYFLPIPEKVYRRLLMLQNVLYNFIPHTAALNPKGFRTFRSHRKLLTPPCRGVLDGELIWKFLSLSVAEKQDVVKKIGTKVDELIDDLRDIDRITAHF